MAMNIDAAVNITADVNGQSAVDQLAQGLQQVGRQGAASAGQIQNAMRMVPAQLTDIATQLAGGQSPMLILMQQGGQLRDMFGSVGGALSGVAKTILGYLTPLNMAVAAIAAVGYAAYEGSEQSKALNKQILLTGGAAGYTAGQLENMAHVLSDTQGIAAGTARDLTTGLAATGSFVGQNLDNAAAAAAKLQKLTDQSSSEIIKDFDKMAGGVASWAAEHNRQFNYLSFAQFKHIKQLEEMGDKEGAIKANIDALNKSLQDRKRDLGTLETAWDAVKRSASAAWDAMLNVGREETPEAKLDGLKKKLAELQAAGGARKGWFGELIVDPEGSTELAKQAMANLLTEITKQQSIVDKLHKEATEKAKEEAKIRQQIEDDQSGRAEALANAVRQKKLERMRGEMEDRIAFFEEEGQLTESRYRAGLITEDEYNNKKLDIAKATLNARMKLLEQEAALERGRETHSPADAVQKETKLLQLQNQRRQLEDQANMAGLKADEDRAAYLRKMQEGLDQFSRTQTNRVNQIKLEADSIGMSTLEYKKHTEALRIDKEAADAAKGQTPEFVAKINAEAEAQKKATLAALDYADAKSKSFDSGIQSALKDYVENTTNAANQAKRAFSNAFSGMEDALVNFVKTGKLDFKSLADSIISDLVRIAIQTNITRPLAMAMGGMDFGSMFKFADGGIMTGAGALPLNKYANGGVADKPQLALFGEGKTPEAFVPLPDGRHIPVAMQGGGGSNVTVNVVNNASNAKATAQERTDSNGQRIIDVMIEQVKASIAGDISRGVGTVTAALERTYGANRAAGAY